MPPISDISALFLMGFLGSAHCLGMCGGFAVLARSSGSTAAWALGKTVTYAILGALAGGLGHLVMGALPVQRGLSVFVGLVLIAIGAAVAGLIPDRLLIPGALMARLGPWLGKAAKASRPWGSLGLGLVNGLLPCGLVLAALMKAMESGTPATAVVLMTVFGLATLPALLLLAWLGHRIDPVWRGRMARVGGWLVLLFGLMTIWRALAVTGAHIM